MIRTQKEMELEVNLEVMDLPYTNDKEEDIRYQNDDHTRFRQDAVSKFSHALCSST
jgi:hypothetical protein